MSARNFLSAREKNINKLIDCLPNINQHHGYRSGQELPALSANTGSLLNRNLNYKFDVSPYFTSPERAGTPFSDFFSESETGTPDFRSEESDSSTGSVLLRNTAEATKILAEEWDRIERTIYDEDGDKATRPHIIEECDQWKLLHPQLRVIGKAIQLPEKRLSYKQIEHEEVIAMHYSDYEQFSESEDRLSQSSADITPQNSPRVSIAEDFREPKVTKDRVTFLHNYDEQNLSDSFCSLLQITPIHIHSPLHRKKHNPCILRSDMASSKWMKNRPESSVNVDRNSAKSYVSLEMRSYNTALSASEANNIFNRVVTARHREVPRLEPLFTPEHQNENLRTNGVSNPVNIRKVSLPPLILDDEKRKASVSSAKKHNIKTKKNSTRSYYNLDRAKH